MRVGTLADAAMPIPPLRKRREPLARAADAGLDHVLVADYISLHAGMGTDGQVWVGIGRDRQKARERLARAMEGRYRVPFAQFEKYGPYGGAEEIAQALAAYAEAGCQDFNLMPLPESTEAGIDTIARVEQLLEP